jgi:hypothetical protein
MGGSSTRERRPDSLVAVRFFVRLSDVPLAPQLGDSRLFITAARLDPDALDTTPSQPCQQHRSKSSTHPCISAICYAGVVP